VNISSEVKTVDEALEKLVFVFHKSYRGKDKNGNYLIDGCPYTDEQVIIMANTGNCIVNRQ